MFELKRISKEAIPAALEKAERYRLLNEPREAESICRDILAVDACHRDALLTLLLSLTDQFGHDFGVGIESAREVLGRLTDDYQRAYYSGIIHERWGKALLGSGLPDHAVFGWFREAMSCYEKAEALEPPAHRDAILRWNTCARIMQRLEDGRPGGADSGTAQAADIPME